jgi:hypothetical protein
MFFWKLYSKHYANNRFFEKSHLESFLAKSNLDIYINVQFRKKFFKVSKQVFTKVYNSLYSLALVTNGHQSYRKGTKKLRLDIMVSK